MTCFISMALNYTSTAHTHTDLFLRPLYWIPNSDLHFHLNSQHTFGNYKFQLLNAWLPSTGSVQPPLAGPPAPCDNSSAHQCSGPTMKLSFLPPIFNPRGRNVGSTSPLLPQPTISPQAHCYWPCLSHFSELLHQPCRSTASFFYLPSCPLQSFVNKRVSTTILKCESGDVTSLAWPSMTPHPI